MQLKNIISQITVTRKGVDTGHVAEGQTIRSDSSPLAGLCAPCPPLPEKPRLAPAVRPCPRHRAHPGRLWTGEALPSRAAQTPWAPWAHRSSPDFSVGPFSITRKWVLGDVSPRFSSFSCGSRPASEGRALNGSRPQGSLAFLLVPGKILHPLICSVPHRTNEQLNWGNEASGQVTRVLGQLGSRRDCSPALG